MQMLHPNAVWYFFLSRTMATIFLTAFLTVWMFIGILSATGGSFLLIFVLLLYIPSFIITYIWAHLFYKTYKYELRDDAFRKEHGVIWKKYVSVPYGRIQNVDIYRGLLARLLGLSDLHIQTAGNSGVAATEGRLPGLTPQIAEQLRDELIRRAKSNPQSPPV